MLPGVGSVPVGGCDAGQRVRSHLQTHKRSFISAAVLHLFTPDKSVKSNQWRTLSGLMRESIRPSSMSAISCRIPSRASQKRSISALSSDSVGSIMRVPATGHDMVGAWKPGRQHKRKTKSDTSSVGFK